MSAHQNITSKYPLRVRLAGEIVAEIVVPVRQTGKVAIIATGLPSSPSKGELLRFLADQGYVAISPRYRGTWESGGYFLDHSPAQDITDVIDALVKNQSVTDLMTGQQISIQTEVFHLFGFSFGGPAVILNSTHPRVKKVIAVSPVLDWSREGEDEPFEKHVAFVTSGFGGAYRLRHQSDWQKLARTDFYNPLTQTHRVDGRKIFILHAHDDRVVPYEPAIEFIAKTNASCYLKPHGGHQLCLMHGFLWKKITCYLAHR